MAKHLKPQSRLTEVIWIVVRRMILTTLRRSANWVLLTRQITEKGQEPRRWMRRDVERFMSKVMGEAEEMRSVANLDALAKAGNRLMVEMAIFTSAAYRVLLDYGIPADNARMLVADVGWDYYARLLRLTSLPFRLTSRDPGSRLRRTIRLLLWFPFSAPGAPGYAVDVRLEGPNILTHFTHCPPQTFVRTLIATKGDRGDLEAFRQSWCTYDWPGADLIADDGKRGHYVRNQTLSAGDPRCDMCWAARGREET